MHKRALLLLCTIFILSALPGCSAIAPQSTDEPAGDIIVTLPPSATNDPRNPVQIFLDEFLYYTEKYTDAHFTANSKPLDAQYLDFQLSAQQHIIRCLALKYSVMQLVVDETDFDGYMDNPELTQNTLRLTPDGYDFYCAFEGWSYKGNLSSDGALSYTATDESGAVYSVFIRNADDAWECYFDDGILSRYLYAGMQTFFYGECAYNALIAPSAYTVEYADTYAVKKISLGG